MFLPVVAGSHLADRTRLSAVSNLLCGACEALVCSDGDYRSSVRGQPVQLAGRSVLQASVARHLYGGF